MNNRIVLLVSGLALALSVQSLCAEQSDSVVTPQFRNSLDLCPVSPLFKIYAIQYGNRFTPRGEGILGLQYTNIHYDNSGNTNAFGLIFGYRYFLWKTLHLEYQLWPTWDNYYEKNEAKYYRGFDLYNEFRVGYQWDFSLFGAAAYLNLQWPLGFGLYSSNKPESFKQQERDNRFFFFPPLFFLGIRF